MDTEYSKRIVSHSKKKNSYGTIRFEVQTLEFELFAAIVGLTEFTSLNSLHETPSQTRCLPFPSRF